MDKIFKVVTCKIHTSWEVSSFMPRETHVPDAVLWDLTLKCDYTTVIRYSCVALYHRLMLYVSVQDTMLLNIIQDEKKLPMHVSEVGCGLEWKSQWIKVQHNWLRTHSRRGHLCHLKCSEYWTPQLRQISALLLQRCTGSFCSLCIIK